MSIPTWAPPGHFNYNVYGDPVAIAHIKGWAAAENVTPHEGGDDDTETFFGGFFTEAEIERLRRVAGDTVEEAHFLGLRTDDVETYRAWLKGQDIPVVHEVLEQPEGFFNAYYRPDDIETISTGYLGTPPL